LSPSTPTSPASITRTEDEWLARAACLKRAHWQGALRMHSLRRRPPAISLVSQVHRSSPGGGRVLLRCRRNSIVSSNEQGLGVVDGLRVLGCRSGPTDEGEAKAPQSKVVRGLFRQSKTLPRGRSGATPLQKTMARDLLGFDSLPPSAIIYHAMLSSLDKEGGAEPRGVHVAGRDPHPAPCPPLPGRDPHRSLRRSGAAGCGAHRPLRRRGACLHPARDRA
jgi:hypothetical protein